MRAEEPGTSTSVFAATTDGSVVVGASDEAGENVLIGIPNGGSALPRGRYLWAVRD